VYGLLEEKITRKEVRGDLEKVKKYSPTFLNYGIEKNLKELENLC